MLSILKKFSVLCLRTDDGLKKAIAAKPDCILVPSYSAVRRDELARATKENLLKAINLQYFWFKKATIFFGSCQHTEDKPFPDAWRMEEAIKFDLLEGFGVVNFMSLGRIESSISEILALRRKLEEMNRFPRAILIVTCELHSRSEKVLAEQVFPGTPIVIICNSHRYEVQPDHPTPDQASWPRWLLASWLRYLAFKASSWGLVSLSHLSRHKHSY